MALSFPMESITNAAPRPRDPPTITWSRFFFILFAMASTDFKFLEAPVTTES
jgi:hypothetical protein